jgi:nucleoside 2-deoxyribosyltransferase
MNKLTCFLASAFDHNDVDSIYLKAIKPILSELNISVLRVDKINHNKKIDAKIIELINKCDFGIADLTYARPSVYYEAGFIEGLKKEVIYICKIDHFSPKLNDKNGNERIHFDLLTKNIISWSEAIEVFRKRLKSRVILIQKPLLKQTTKTEEELKSQSEFISMSHNERLKVLEMELKEFLIKNKFKESKLRFHHNIYQKGKLRVKINVKENATESDLKYSRYSTKEVSEFGKFKLFTINCYIKPVPKSRIERSLSFYKPLTDNLYQWEEIKIKFLDSIDSLYKLKNTLKKMKLA